MKLACTAFALALLGLSGGVPDMRSPRAAHTASLLPSGAVLVVGGCTVDGCELDERGASTELFQPASGRFVAGPRLAAPRVGHTATVLADGSVLIAGGWDGPSVTGRAEVYDESASRFAPVGSLRTPRGGATATRLRNGRVLVAGGTRGRESLASAELYDSRTRRFVPTGRMSVPRGGHAAALLRDGRVLVVGGSRLDGPVHRSAELYDPRAGRFIPAAAMSVRRHKHAAVVLRDGRVLVVGGSDARDFGGRHASAELYEPGRRRFRRVGGMTQARFKLPEAVVRLPSGAVLVAGGGATAERYDPRARRFSPAAGTGMELAFSTATVLRDGSVLVAGGYDNRIRPTSRAWRIR